MNRRKFIQQTSLATAILPSVTASQYNPVAQPQKLHVSCNLYTWFSYYNRLGKDFYADLDAGIKEVAESGVDGIEPSLTLPSQVDAYAPLLEKYGLEMQSVYVNSKLHIKEEADRSIDSVLGILERCKALGTRIVVTNPSPLSWASKDNKTDQQLLDQAEALDRLGAEVKKLGMVLSYHTHDPEFRAGAREFHHMMQATNPEHVTFCMDVHWVYRGALNSNVALFDVMDMYGDRITELHIRQSDNHVWTEVFGEGDIPYERVVQKLKGMQQKPFLVLEQAVEEGTPDTITPLESHKLSQKHIRNVFAPLVG